MPGDLWGFSSSDAARILAAVDRLEGAHGRPAGKHTLLTVRYGEVVNNLSPGAVGDVTVYDRAAPGDPYTSTTVVVKARDILIQEMQAGDKVLLYLIHSALGADEFAMVRESSGAVPVSTTPACCDGCAERTAPLQFEAVMSGVVNGTETDADATWNQTHMLAFHRLSSSDNNSWSCYFTVVPKTGYPLTLSLGGAQFGHVYQWAVWGPGVTLNPDEPIIPGGATLQASGEFSGSLTSGQEDCVAISSKLVVADTLGAGTEYDWNTAQIVLSAV